MLPMQTMITNISLSLSAETDNPSGDVLSDWSPTPVRFNDRAHQKVEATGGGGYRDCSFWGCYYLSFWAPFKYYWKNWILPFLRHIWPLWAIQHSSFQRSPKISFRNSSAPSHAAVICGLVKNQVLICFDIINVLSQNLRSSGYFSFHLIKQGVTNWSQDCLISWYLSLLYFFPFPYYW